MLIVPDALYTDIARLLARELDEVSYFNGSVERQTGEFAATLTATLIVYRSGGRVSDIVPVWWEFEMLQPGGEVPTDFCWSELKGYLMDHL